MFWLLQSDQNGIEAEARAAYETVQVVRQKRGDLRVVVARRSFAGSRKLAQEGVQFEWLLTATNAFVNAVCPQLLRLLAQVQTPPKQPQAYP